LDSLPTICGLGGFVAAELERPGEKTAYGGIIVNDQDDR